MTDSVDPRIRAEEINVQLHNADLTEWARGYADTGFNHCDLTGEWHDGPKHSCPICHPRQPTDPIATLPNKRQG